MTHPENRNYAFAEAFVDELAKSGLRHACICPGSRSMPLVIAFARCPDIKNWVHVDERSAAFFALGIARALNEPVAIVCTSGTASANFYPAVMEARYSMLPLLVLTADRPPELWEWGSPQTADQTRMYGTNVKYSFNMATPEVTTDLMRYVRAEACRAIANTQKSPAGAVHINFPFREPLEPQYVPSDFLGLTNNSEEESVKGLNKSNACLNVLIGSSVVDLEQTTSMAKSLDAVERGLIVCGPQYNLELPDLVVALAAKLGFPILADPLSQVRCGSHDRDLVIDHYDLFLRDSDTLKSLTPDLILRFGAIPTSKTLITFLQRQRQARHILVNEGTWQDPFHVATDIVCADAARFTKDLISLVSIHNRNNWVVKWLEVSNSTRIAILDQMNGMQKMFEGKVFSELSLLLPSTAAVFAGNSMPVRDLDAFFPSTPKKIRFMSNRGVNGIDGVLSSALGASSVLIEPLVLVLGDLSFYHDMNGLIAAKQYSLNVTVIVVNNDGGGIFSFLPQSKYPEYFERYFATPHGLTFEAAASLYDIPYTKVFSWPEFHTVVCQSIESPGSAIVEVPSQRDQNVGLHRCIWKTVAQAVESTMTDLI